MVQSCARLALALKPLMRDPESAKQIAFNLADIWPELTELDRLLTGVEKAGTIQKAELSRIYELLCVHWLYHATEIKRIIDGMDDIE